MATRSVIAFPKERAVYELGGLQPSDLAKLLNRLTDQLLLQGRIDTAMTEARSTSPAGTTASPSAPIPPSFWIRLLEGTRESLIGLGCDVKLQITTGFLSAELRGCTGQ